MLDNPNQHYEFERTRTFYLHSNMATNAEISRDLLEISLDLLVNARLRRRIYLPLRRSVISNNFHESDPKHNIINIPACSDLLERTFLITLPLHAYIYKARDRGCVSVLHVVITSLHRLLLYYSFGPKLHNDIVYGEAPSPQRPAAESTRLALGAGASSCSIMHGFKPRAPRQNLRSPLLQTISQL